MSSIDLDKQIIWPQEIVSLITFFFPLKCTSLQKQPFPSLMVSPELTSSVHQPHFSPAWMHSPQDWAEALVHSLPSAHTRAQTSIIITRNTLPPLTQAIQSKEHLITNTVVNHTQHDSLSRDCHFKIDAKMLAICCGEVMWTVLMMASLLPSLKT